MQSQNSGFAIFLLRIILNLTVINIFKNKYQDLGEEPGSKLNWSLSKINWKKFIFSALVRILNIYVTNSLLLVFKEWTKVSPKTPRRKKIHQYRNSSNQNKKNTTLLHPNNTNTKYLSTNAMVTLAHSWFSSSAMMMRLKLIPILSFRAWIKTSSITAKQEPIRLSMLAIKDSWVRLLAQVISSFIH